MLCWSLYAYQVRCNIKRTGTKICAKIINNHNRNLLYCAQYCKIAERYLFDIFSSFLCSSNAYLHYNNVGLILNSI